MGSIPVRVTKETRTVKVLVSLYGDIAQLVRAFASHARGHGFESPCLHQRCKPPKGGFFAGIGSASGFAGFLTFE